MANNNLKEVMLGAPEKIEGVMTNNLYNLNVLYASRLKEITLEDSPNMDYSGFTLDDVKLLLDVTADGTHVGNDINGIINAKNEYTTTLNLTARKNSSFLATTLEDVKWIITKKLGNGTFTLKRNILNVKGQLVLSVKGIYFGLTLYEGSLALLGPIIAENPLLGPIIAENPLLVNNIVDLLDYNYDKDMLSNAVKFNIGDSIEYNSYLKQDSNGTITNLGLYDNFSLKCSVEFKIENRNYSNTTYPSITAYTFEDGNGSTGIGGLNSTYGTFYCDYNTGGTGYTRIQPAGKAIGSILTIKIEPSGVTINDVKTTRSYTLWNRLIARWTLIHNGTGRFYYYKTFDDNNKVTHCLLPLGNDLLVDAIDFKVYEVPVKNLYTLVKE